MWAVCSVVWGWVGMSSRMCHGFRGVRVWGKCCCMYMKQVIGMYVVSYYVCVCVCSHYVHNKRISCVGTGLYYTRIWEIIN